MARVLVVEDDKLLRKAIKEELEEANFQVSVAESVDEVERRLAEDEIKLIYLDIMLPGDLDGFGILRKLKEPDSLYREIPIIMLSNLGQMDQMDSARELGAADYIVKASIDLPRLVEITKEKLGIIS